MCDGCALRIGADAAGDLLEDVFRIPIAKALNPLNPASFVAIIRRIARELRNAAGPLEQKAVRKVQELVAVDWPRMTRAQRDNVLAEVKRHLKSTALLTLPKVEGVMKGHAEVLVGDTRKRLVKKYDFAIGSTMTVRDTKTAKRLVETEALFVRNNAGAVAEGLSEKARSIVANGLKEGLGRDEISEKLQLALVAARRPDHYWNLIAGVFANRARTFTQLHSFEEAGVKAYTLLAVLDEVTTDYCRMIDGMEFPVDQAVERIQRIQESDPEDIVELTPWARTGRDDEGRQILYYKQGGERHRICVVEESGVGEKDRIGTYSHMLAPEALARGGMTMPPFHGNCRTSVLPVF